ncbi:MAG: class I SAM-dependent methyltransferase [Clostridiales bacterium]|nr:class I SAM-dependent methyltransferase [Clostridiales bacterium]MCF8022872.1 class I SAM-dependent methyltransferase [Clostridiales bacterium]
MKSLPTSPDFWKKMWQEALETSPVARRRCRSEEELVENWNKRARWFARRAGDKNGGKRQQAVLNMLKEKGALKEGYSVLDIGAGPGNFSIPMACTVEQVTALEPAAGMVEILKENAQTEQLNNIEVVERTWQDIDIEKDKLSGKFDLVFASMSPGIRDHETLDKMLRASREFCYMSGFSGRRWGQPYIDLWEHFFAEDIGDTPGDILYPWGYLYASGYRPETRFSTIRHVNEEPVEKAVENLTRFFWAYMDITPEVKQDIERYVQKRAENDIFSYENTVCQGMILWKVQ